jgi:DNA-binding GntR family transcriptional regulator
MTTDQPAGTRSPADPYEALEPPTGATLAADIAERLRVLILDGRLAPGTRLRLAALAQTLGVSVMPVRDALRILEAENLVLALPRRGARVAVLSEEDAEEIYAVRAALESLAARYGAVQLTDDDIREIRGFFHLMEEDAARADLTSFIEHDQAFHYRLYSVSQRERLLLSITELRRRSHRYVPYIHRGLHDFARRLELHRPILEAIEARDVEAVVRLTRDHLESDPPLIAEELRKKASLVPAPKL